MIVLKSTDTGPVWESEQRFRSEIQITAQVGTMPELMNQFRAFALAIGFTSTSVEDALGEFE